MKELVAITSALALGIIGVALAQEKRSTLKIDPSLPVSVTPMERGTVKDVLRFLRDKGSPPPLAFKVPAQYLSLPYCEFGPLNQINNAMRCVDIAQTLICPKEVVVRTPSGGTVVKEIECDGPPTEGPDGPECECDFKK